MKRGVWIILAALAPLTAQPYETLTGKERAQWFVNSTYSPTSLLVSGPLLAGWRTYRDHPRDWGRGPDGYAKRYGTHLLTNTVANGIEASLGARLNEDPRYFRLGDGTFGQRFGQTLKQTFMSRYPDGSYRFGMARAAGYSGGAFVRRLYMPNHMTTHRTSTIRIGGSYSGRFLGNVFREFGPDMRRMFKKN